MSIVSFLYYHNVKLHLYVVDKDGYSKIYNYFRSKFYFSQLEIIDYYDDQFVAKLTKLPLKYHENTAQFPVKSMHIVLNMFRVMDDVNDDNLVRIDLDVVYLSRIPFENYTHALNGIQERSAYGLYPHAPKIQINVGVCKYTKSKFNLINSFTEEMFSRLNKDGQGYAIPDQDLLNEMTTDKCILDINAYPSINYSEILTTRIDCIHFTGTWNKPWRLIDEVNCVNHAWPILLGFILFGRFAHLANLPTDTIDFNLHRLSPQFYKLSNKTKELVRCTSEVDKWMT